jgi:hypothetical protein
MMPSAIERDVRYGGRDLRGQTLTVMERRKRRSICGLVNDEQ